MRRPRQASSTYPLYPCVYVLSLIGPASARGQTAGTRLIAPPQPLCYRLGGPSGRPSAAHFQAVDAEAPIPEFAGPGTRPRLKSVRPGGKALVRGR